jgi:hypothetical protein
VINKAVANILSVRGPGSRRELHRMIVDRLYTLTTGSQTCWAKKPNNYILLQFQLHKNEYIAIKSPIRTSITSSPTLTYLRIPSLYVFINRALTPTSMANSPILHIKPYIRDRLQTLNSPPLESQIASHARRKILLSTPSKFQPTALITNTRWNRREPWSFNQLMFHLA